MEILEKQDTSLAKSIYVNEVGPDVQLLNGKPMDCYFSILLKIENLNLAKDEIGNQYVIRILGRGDNLLFIENKKGLICTIDEAHGIIYGKSIKKWYNTDEVLSIDERRRAVGLIEKYYGEFYNPKVIMDEDDNPNQSNWLKEG
ncbi:carbapenam-3-carboxylate synthase domain-containing protein [Sphingobacterium sp. SYP-B4668]|uniref:carbapenam-3-carboxylate synthase domain-containing protein n=1 Tax=Sphingobacterium sp. SYP-B4668 TaxID=2996035 RepID=UPI0022DD639B|nr:carbapenam-3-carboxylate synthase domain-containing protein [Sphingobacterium sp. SYP-B4668]